MKKRIQKSIYILTVLFMIFTLINGVSESTFAQTAQPQNITNSFGKEAETEHNFTWVTSSDIKESVIEYCIKDEFAGFDKNNIKIATAAGYEATTDLDKREIHKVELVDLKPGTDYVYRVGTLGNYSPQGIFRTAGNEPSGFTFLNITDTQGSTARDYAVWKNTLDKALAKFPQVRFLIHTGDMVDDGQKISQWDLFMGAVTNELIKLPIAPAVGNHEVLNKNKTNSDAKNFTDSFDNPKEGNTGAPSGTVYSFDYGNTHIAVMNTECDSINLKKQADWLRRDMAGSAKLWKIVALHRGPYGATYDSTAIRNAWTPVFDELGIDLVLQGHDHNYVRSYSMKNGAEAKNGKGTLYITGNSGGVKFYPLKPRSWQKVDLQPKTQMYIAVTVNNNRMLIQAYDVNNTLRDSITLDKLAIVLDGQKLSSDTQPYVNQDNRTMVPLRLISENLGAEVSWDNSKRQVTIMSKGDNIQMTIDTKTVMRNGEKIEMDTNPIIQDNRVMVPLRFIAEYLGASVKWDQDQKIVYIYSQNHSLN